MISQIHIDEIFFNLIMLWHLVLHFFLTSLLLKKHHENKTIGLFCVILIILFFPTNTAIYNIGFYFIALMFCTYLNISFYG